MRMVFLRPRRSAESPAKKAPKKAPPVKTETTAPLVMMQCQLFLFPFCLGQEGGKDLHLIRVVPKLRDEGLRGDG